MTYTAKELSDILTKTKIDSIKNKPLLMPETDRILSEKAQSDDAPELGKFLYSIGGTEAIAMCMNYWKIRDEVRAYQAEHNVSGLVDRVFKCRGKEITYLEWDEQLILQDWDIPALKKEVSKVIDFFIDAAQDYDICIDVIGNDDDEQFIPIPEEAIRRRAAIAVSCFAYSQSLQWSQEKDGTWTGHFIERDEPDKIQLVMHLDLPDAEKPESVRIAAKHRDRSRYPWME